MSYRQRDFNIPAATFRLIAGLLEHWKLAVIVAFFLSPVGPHLRWEYQYRDVYGYRTFISCTYLGSRGFTRVYLDDCPVIAWLDARNDRQ